MVLFFNMLSRLGQKTKECCAPTLATAVHSLPLLNFERYVQNADDKAMAVAGMKFR